MLPCFMNAAIFLSFCHASRASPSATQIQANNGTELPPKQGWTSAPNTRGTLDIMQSCGLTMFLCSWSVLFLNVPSSEDTRLRIFIRKLWITALAFLGPEFIFQIALGQWLSAYRSTEKFQASGYKDWTMSHAFFADMGGFILETNDWAPFPIDSKQLYYLIEKGYIECPNIHKQHISDKNKVDGLLRLLTLGQIFWFLLNMVGRHVQNLEITAGELTTAAFIVCSTGTMFCWYHKPADVGMPETIRTNVKIADILLGAGEVAAAPYSRTPLDFASRKEWSWSKYWSNWINILRNMGIVFGPQVRPVTRFENTLSLELPGFANWVFLFMTAIYSSIFICGWDYSFPTDIEMIMWRGASCTMIATLVTYWAFTEFGFNWYPKLRARSRSDVAEVVDVEKDLQTPDRMVKHGWIRRKLRSIAAAVRNNSVSKDPELDVPLKAILPIYVVGVFYCFARTYLFLADIIQLRSLPASAYQTVEWMAFIPHF